MESGLYREASRHLANGDFVAERSADFFFIKHSKKSPNVLLLGKDLTRESEHRLW
jgi:hypothetical protein